MTGQAHIFFVRVNYLTLHIEDEISSISGFDEGTVFCLASGENLLCSLALGDVGENACYSEWFAVRVLKANFPVGDPPFCAVGKKNPVLQFNAAIAKQRSARGLDCGFVFGVGSLDPALRRNLTNATQGGLWRPRRFRYTRQFARQRADETARLAWLPGLPT